MPGAGKQSLEVQQQIKDLLEAGFDPTTIHRRLNVGRSSIYRMKRCLKQHGTAYMPVELNKKNGRPKVLTAEQELAVRDWLLIPQNRTKYLDDLVWLIHDRFGIICSTTTMSKLKRKWLATIESEESGGPLAETVRLELLKTDPRLQSVHQIDNHRAPLRSNDEQAPDSGEISDEAALQMQLDAEAVDAQIDARLLDELRRHQHTLDPAIAEELQQPVCHELNASDVVATAAAATEALEA